MRISLQPAFVLHRRPFGDSSLLLEAFTRDNGRIGLVARGARGTRSRIKGLLQPFIPLLLSWSGRGELLTLTGTELMGAVYPGRMPSGECIYSALYVTELLLRLLVRFDPHPQLFDAYHQVLAELAAGEPQEPALRVFEKRLLGELGYALALDTEAAGGAPIQPQRCYCYVIDRGPIALGVADHGGIPISGRSLLALAAERLEEQEPSVLREVKRLTRAAIDAQLDGKPLRTRQLLLDQRRRARALER